MKKRSILIIGSTLLAGAMAMAQAKTSVQFNWSYTSQTGVPACPSGVTNTCYSGFTITDITANTVVATSSVLGPTVTSYNWTPAGGLFFGTHTFSLVVNGYDNNGNALASTPVTAVATNNLTTLNPPTGFTATTH